MCESWAESGECESNPTFMQKECTSSCANAGKYKTQMQKECEGYALAGECSRNPAFMLSTCRKECDRWEASKGGAVSIANGALESTPASPTDNPHPGPEQVRIDRNSQCVEWSLMGKCKGNPGHDMAKECNTSCTIAHRCAQSSFSGWSIGTCDKVHRAEAWILELQPGPGTWGCSLGHRHLRRGAATPTLTLTPMPADSGPDHGLNLTRAQRTLSLSLTLTLRQGAAVRGRGQAEQLRRPGGTGGVFVQRRVDGTELSGHLQRGRR